MFTLDRPTEVAVRIVENFERKKQSGFRRLSLRMCLLGFRENTQNLVYIGENFTLKKPYLVGEKPPLACPTLDLENGWVIQPTCVLATRKKIKEMKEENLVTSWGWLKIDGAGEDAHPGNWGFLPSSYGGGVCVIDW